MARAGPAYFDDDFARTCMRFFDLRDLRRLLPLDDSICLQEESTLDFPRDARGCLIIWPDSAMTETHNEDRLRLDAVLDGSRDAIVSMDENGVVVDFNTAAEKIHGYTRDQVVGRKAADMLIAQRFQDTFAEVLSAGFARFLNRTILVPMQISGGDEALTEVTIIKTELSSKTIYTAYIRDVSDRESAKRELEIRARQQATVAELGRLAIAGIEPEVLIDIALRMLTKTFEVEFGGVLEMIPNSDRGLLSHGIGWHENYVGRYTASTLPSESLAGHTLQQNTTRVVEDWSSETRFPGSELLKAHGVVSGMGVVIPGTTGPFGILGVHTARKRTFTSEDADFLQSVAYLLGDAIEHKRSEEAMRESEALLKKTDLERRRLLRRLVTAHEEERVRVARELHDELGQTLASIAMFAGRLEEELKGDAAKWMSSLRKLVEEATKSTRALVWSLRPVELDALGLVAATERLITNLHDQHGLRVDLYVDGVTRLPEDVETAAYRIIQEALNNTIKHAKAGFASVVLTRRGTVFSAIVEDDGIGFDLKSVGRRGWKGERLGLLDMEERAEAIGGRLAVESGSKRGTIVRLEVPLNSETRQA